MRLCIWATWACWDGAVPFRNRWPWAQDCGGVASQRCAEKQHRLAEARSACTSSDIGACWAEPHGEAVYNVQPCEIPWALPPCGRRGDGMDGSMMGAGRSNCGSERSAGVLARRPPQGSSASSVDVGGGGGIFGVAAPAGESEGKVAGRACISWLVAREVVWPPEPLSRWTQVN